MECKKHKDQRSFSNEITTDSVTYRPLKQYVLCHLLVQRDKLVAPVVQKYGECGGGGGGGRQKDKNSA